MTTEGPASRALGASRALAGAPADRSARAPRGPILAAVGLVAVGLAAVGGLGLGGCRTGRGAGGDWPEPPEPAALLASLRRQGEGRTNLRAMGRVTALGPDGRVRLRTVLVAERPRSFRFETLTPFEQPIDVMTSDGERLWLLRDGRLFEGPATPENVARLLPLPMRPAEVVETLLGGVPVSDRFAPERVEPVDAGWRLHLRAPNGDRGVLLIEPRRRRVLEAELRDAAGQLLVGVRFDRFEPADDGGPAVPTAIEVEVPPRRTRVRLRLTEAETDVALPPALFVVRPPAGTRPEPFGLPAPPPPAAK